LDYIEWRQAIKNSVWDGRLRQEGHKFEASLGYRTRPCLRRQINQKKKKEFSLGNKYDEQHYLYHL
jgi:hypothetical protein